MLPRSVPANPQPRQHPERGRRRPRTLLQRLGDLILTHLPQLHRRHLRRQLTNHGQASQPITFSHGCSSFPKYQPGPVADSPASASRMGVSDRLTLPTTMRFTLGSVRSPLPLPKSAGGFVSKLLFEFGDEVACPLGLCGGAGGDGLEVAQGSLGVKEGLPVAVGLPEGESDVVATAPGGVAVVLTLLVLDGLLEMAQGGIVISHFAVDDSEQIVGCGQLVYRIWGEHFECLLVGGCSVGEVAGLLLGRFPGQPGVAEPLVGDGAELANDSSAAEGFMVFEQIETTLVPAFGLVEVAQGGDVLVGMPEVEGNNAF